MIIIKIRNFLKSVATALYTHRKMMFLTLSTHLPIVVSASSHTVIPVCGGVSLLGMRTKFDLTRARKFTKTKFCCSQTIAFGDLHLVS